MNKFKLIAERKRIFCDSLLEPWTRELPHILWWFTGIAKEKFISNRDFMSTTGSNTQF
jgi:hypothetical protein